MTSTHREPDFNLIARPYRWFEYLTLGRALERCRDHFLGQLCDRRRALVLGDGDGRFLAQLLAHNPHLRADAVDTSITMLRLLRQRSEAATPDANTRLNIHHCDALTFPLAGRYDLVITHFFLDCLTQADLDTLVTQVASVLSPGGLWLVSDFRTPTGFMRLPAMALIRGLYFAFRVLTGLRTVRLPDHVTPFTRSGLIRVAQRHSFAGMLTTELWQA
ncbi:MAG TPA: class I SAM-dependent methyltransferase [Edaphobacter sp.]